ncbi:MAG: transglycosylase [Bacteroidetes bacterium]|nr:transglycosylase [Bacteroidota bacterium]
MRKKIIFITALLAAVLISCTTSKNHPKTNDGKIASSDLEVIRERGKLVAVTDFNSTNYFVYKGEPMGFHFELLNEFTDHLGVDLEIITENHLDRAFELL